MHIMKLLYWATRIVASLILLQTLYFKFTASPESVYIFTTVGMEPWGRIGVGVAEAVAGVLLLITPVAWWGAALALGLMVGAIGMHFTLLGIEVQGDGGYLFFLALVVSLCAAFILWVDQQKIRETMEKLLKR
jgi:uncharacterized membrane protein YphA (DoxX/SURF4 family)